MSKVGWLCPSRFCEFSGHLKDFQDTKQNLHPLRYFRQMFSQSIHLCVLTGSRQLTGQFCLKHFPNSTKVLRCVSEQCLNFAGARTGGILLPIDDSTSSGCRSQMSVAAFPIRKLSPFALSFGQVVKTGQNALFQLPPGISLSGVPL